jgi:hypothetical protein
MKWQESSMKWHNPVAQGAGGRRPAATRLATVVASAVLTLVVAACGSSTPSNGVARLDSPGPSGSPVASGSPGTSAAPSASDYAQLLLAYSHCMRDHGFANFPDPQIDGGSVRLPSLQGTGIDPSSATFRAADSACQSLMPTPPPQARQPMSPQDQAKWLQFSACVRSHGVPEFPDPDFSNGGPKPFFDWTPATDADPSTLGAATQACQPLLPVLGDGSGSASPSGSTASPSPSSQP